MKILILGAGKMGSFFTDVLSFDHECAVYEVDPQRMRFLYNTQRFTTFVVERQDIGEETAHLAGTQNKNLHSAIC